MSSSLDPTPRDFSHTNISNPSRSWGDKFESHCLAGANPSRKNCLIGDSFVERLGTRPALRLLCQEYFPDWENYGIGGDRTQHVQWRVDHGGYPERPGKTVYMCGSNNLKTCNTKEASTIANSILATIRNLQTMHPSSELCVLGILPRENNAKCRAAHTINNILSFKLPASVKFVPPPSVFSSDDGLPNSIYF